MGSGESAVKINKTVSYEARDKASYLKRKSHQIVIDRTFNMNDFPKEICGMVLSTVEETFPFESKNNILWIVQQIVHFVCATRTGLNKNLQIYRGTQCIEVDGDQIKMFTDFYSFVYGVGGEWLKSDNIDKMKIRFVMGFRYKVDKTVSMRANTVKILEAKGGVGDNITEKTTFKTLFH